MRFRRRPIIIEATQWFKHGDHPFVFNLPADYPEYVENRKKFGWLKTGRKEGHLIKPGDWIIEHGKMEFSSCNSETFQRLYEPDDFVKLIRGKGERSA